MPPPSKPATRRWSALPVLALAVACAGGEAETANAGSTSSSGGEGGATTASSSSSSGEGGTGATGGGGSGGAGGQAGGGGVGCDPPPGNADHPPESEPNGDLPSATPLPGGALGLSAQICPAGDVDVYTRTVAAGQSLRVSIGDGAGGCPTELQPLVQIFDPAAQLLVEEVGFGCLVLGPDLFPALAALAGGIYEVRVASYEAIASGAYVVTLSAESPSCGDGLTQAALGEQCDDGGEADGDGCSASCALEGGTYVAEIEPDDTVGTATPVGPADGGVGALEPAGDVDHWSFEIAVAGSAVSALVSDGLGGCPAGFDSTLTLFDPSASPIASDDNAGPALCSFIDPGASPGAVGLPAGTYTLAVASALGAAQSSYVLTVEVHLPGCADAILGPGEQCDDGNFAPGDGCAPDCTAESPWEIEPNGSLPESTPAWPATTRWNGRIEPIGDVDWFSFDVAQGANVTLSTNNLGNVFVCSYDTILHLVDDGGNELASDDQSGVDSCSKLSPATHPAVANMAAGTYHVWVKEFFDEATIPGYELHLEVQ